MSLMCLLEDWSQWMKETLSLKISQLELPELKKSEQRITIKTDSLWNNYKICAHYRNTRRRERKKKKEGIFKI